MKREHFKLLIKLFAGAAVIAGVWWVVRCQCIRLDSLTPANLRDHIRSFGSLAMPFYVALYVLNTISVVPPIAPLSLAAGLAFGPVRGAALLMTGAVIGTSCTFGISRFFGRKAVEKVLRGRFRKLDEMLKKNGFMTVLFFRVVPIIPYEVLNYASGLSAISYRDYIVATFLGLIPGVVIAAFFGGSLGEIDSAADLLSPKFLIALGLMAFILVVPTIYKLLKKKGMLSRKVPGDV